MQYVIYLTKCHKLGPEMNRDSPNKPRSLIPGILLYLLRILNAKRLAHKIQITNTNFFNMQLMSLVMVKTPIHLSLISTTMNHSWSLMILSSNNQQQNLEVSSCKKNVHYSIADIYSNNDAYYSRLYGWGFR